MLPSLSSILSRLRLKHLRLLIAIDEQGSLLKAAQQLALSQPAATKALQEMEAALGTPLFQRTTRRLEPNDIGRCAIRYAYLIQTDLSLLREEMIGILQGNGGHLSIGVIMGAVPLLTEVLSVLLEKHPTLSVEIIEDTSSQLLHLLDEGKLDIAACRISVSKKPHLYNTTKIQNEKLAVVASLNNPLASANRISLSDLIDFRWIVCSANMPMRLLLEREFKDAGLCFPQNLVETTSAFTTLSLLQRNPSMVALLSTEVSQYCTTFGSTTKLAIDIQSKSEPYFLVTPKGRALSPAAKVFMEDFLQSPSLKV
jgi:DNA-binding transcriptional LysR family regulator